MSPLVACVAVFWVATAAGVRGAAFGADLGKGLKRVGGRGRRGRGAELAMLLDVRNVNFGKPKADADVDVT